jgi:threonine/homoserine/homoserine lactone efflux protein
MDRPPFDPIRASFWLIAAILGVQCLIALMSAVTCIYWTASIVEGHATCEPVMNRLSELLMGALAAALAFSKGYDRKP